MKNLFAKIIIQGLICLLAFPVPPVFGQGLETDNRNPKNTPTIETAPNKIPVINITNPSKAGVSVNNFNQYNVGKKGLVINNNTRSGTSQLAGDLGSNPNFGRKAASVVLMQVTGTNKSNLNGMQEMFGHSAEYILANPNGISVNGAGFINTPKATFVTGRVNLGRNGAILDMYIEGGRISIEGNGLIAGDTDYVGLLSKVVYVDGQINAGDELEIIAGKNSFNYNTHLVTTHKSSREESIVYGIDASKLGGMSAGKINLISTKEGVGVRTQGTLVARQEGIKVSSAGDIVYEKLVANKTIDLNAGNSVYQNGSAYAGTDINITAAGDIILKGKSIVAENKIDISSKGKITLEQNQENDDKVFAEANKIDLTAGGEIQLENADVLAYEEAVLDANGNIIVKNAQLEATNLQLNSKATLRQENAIVLSEDGSIVVSAKNFISKGSHTMAGKDLTIKVEQSLLNENSLLAAGNNTKINAKTVENMEKAVLFAGNDLEIAAEDGIINKKSDILALGKIELSGKEGKRTKLLINDEGTIEAEGDLIIKADRLENRRADTVEIMANANKENAESKKVEKLVGKKISWFDKFLNKEIDETHLKSKTVAGSDTGAFIGSGGDMTIEAGSVINIASTISSGKNLNLNADHVENRSQILGDTYTHYFVGEGKEAYQSCKSFFFVRWDCKTKTRSISVVKKEENFIETGRLNAVISAKGKIKGKVKSFYNGKGAEDVKEREDYKSIKLAELGQAKSADEAYRKAIEDGEVELDLEDKPTKLFSLIGAKSAIKSLKSRGNKDSEETKLLASEQKKFPVLVKINPLLLNGKKYTGSGYLLELLEKNPGGLLLLGDGYYESRLIKKAILSITGTHFLNDKYATPEAQIKALYENAAKIAKSLNLQIGRKLSNKQISNLDKDIIWLVEKRIKGKRVLTPQLYLSKNTRNYLASLANGARLQANVIDIEAEDEIKNAGTMQAIKQLSLKTNKGNIENEGQLISENDLYLESGKELVNVAARIKAGRNADLQAKNDVFLLEQTETSIKHRLKETLSKVKGSLIEIAGNLKIKAGNDITVSGSKIKVDGSASLEAGRDINLVSAEEKTLKETRAHRKQSRKSTTTQVSSSLEVGKNLKTSSGRDTTIFASTIEVGQNANFQTAGDLNILSGQNTTDEWKKSKRVSRGLLSDTVRTKESNELRVKNVASNIKIGGYLIANSKKSMTFLGSNVDVGGHAVLQAKNDINVLAADEGRVYSKHEKTTATAYEANYITKELKVNKVGTQFNVGGALIAESEGTVFVQGATLSGAQGVDIQAKDGITALSAENISKKETHTDKAVLGGILYSKKTDDKKFKLTQSAAVIASERNINLETEGSIFIGGSQIKSGGNTNLNAAKDITIASAAEMDNHFHSEEESQFSGFSTSGTRSSLSFNVEQSGTRTSGETNRLTQKSSVLSVGGNLNIDSGSDVNILGSDIIARNDINIKGLQVNILTQDQIQESINKSAAIKNTISFTIGNSWAESAYSVYDSAKAVDSAQKENDGSQAGQINADIAKVKAALAVAQLAKTTESIARSAATAGTLGFYASVSQKAEISETESNSRSTTSRASSIVSLEGNVDLEAETNLNIHGSLIAANKGNITLTGEEVNIQSKANKSTYSSGDHSYSESQELFNSSGIVSGPTYSKTDSGAGEISITHVNSQILAGNGTLKINSGKDTKVIGANLQAKIVDLTNMGGDLIVKSQQDTTKGSSQTDGYSIGQSNGVNKSTGKTDREWVQNQTTIIGTDEVSIKTNTLELEGVLIANINKDGEDMGNLFIDSDQINIKDLNDKDYSYNESYGLSLNLPGQDTRKTKSKTNATGQPLGGTTSLSFANSGHDRTQITRATLGKGTIKTSSNTSDINRDINQSQEIIKDDSLGGINADISFDNRLITDTGAYVAETVGAVAGLPSNLMQAGQNVGEASNNLKDAILESLTGNGEDGVFGDYQRKISNQELSLQAKIDEALKKAMQNQGKNSEEVEKQLELLGKKALTAYGLKGEDVKVEFFNGDQLTDAQASAEVLGGHADKRKMKGFYDPESKTIYLNVANHNGTSQDLLNTFANELSHRADDLRGYNFSQKRQNVSDRSSTELSRMYGAYNGNDLVNTNEYLNGIKSQAAASGYLVGNYLAGSVTDAQPLDVYYWAPLSPDGVINTTNKKWSGHVSMKLENGLYISNWPASDEEGNPLFRSKFHIVDARVPSFEKDVAAERRMPKIIHIDGLDEVEIENWWNINKKNKFCVVNNCSDTVSQGLRAGGLKLPSHFIYHPGQVNRDIEVALKNIPPPPPPLPSHDTQMQTGEMDLHSNVQKIAE